MVAKGSASVSEASRIWTDTRSRSRLVRGLSKTVSISGRVRSVAAKENFSLRDDRDTSAPIDFSSVSAQLGPTAQSGLNQMT